ncbi:hypothetical protein H5P36_18965 [Bacillus sp. APMAM]|nr:hypothetical protein [Bacillus sp. APMAM]
MYGSYNGEKNISFIGEGTVKVDMKYMKDGIAIIAVPTVAFLLAVQLIQ